MEVLSYSEVLNVLNLCYSKVIPIDNRFLVRQNGEFECKVLDSTGKEIGRAPDYDEILTLGNNLFGVIDYSAVMIDRDTLEANNGLERVYFSILKKLECGAIIINRYGRYGILASDGRLLAPCMYKSVYAAYDTKEIAKLNVSSYVGINASTIARTQCIISDSGTKINHLLTLDLTASKQDEYQIEVVDFGISKDFLEYCKESSEYLGASKPPFLEDCEQFKFKCRPARFGAGIGHKLYDGVYYDKSLEINQLFGVYNIGKDNKIATGIVDIFGNEIIEAKDYSVCSYMGNNIYACKRLDNGYYDIFRNNVKLNIPDRCTGFVNGHKLPIVQLIFENGTILYLSNNNNLVENLTDAFDISKLRQIGNNSDINKINIYGSEYLVYNNLSLLSLKDSNLVKSCIDSDWIMVYKSK